MNPFALVALGLAGWLLLSGKSNPGPAPSLPVPPAPVPLRCPSIPIVAVSSCSLLRPPASFPVNPNAAKAGLTEIGVIPCGIVYAPDQVRCTLSKKIHAADSLGPTCSQQLAANLRGIVFGCNPSGGTFGVVCDGGEFL